MPRGKRVFKLRCEECEQSTWRQCKGFSEPCPLHSLSFCPGWNQLQYTNSSSCCCRRPLHGLFLINSILSIIDHSIQNLYKSFTCFPNSFPPPFAGEIFIHSPPSYLLGCSKKNLAHVIALSLYKCKLVTERSSFSEKK